jgi:hypothetical protein
MTRFRVKLPFSAPDVGMLVRDFPLIATDYHVLIFGSKDIVYPTTFGPLYGVYLCRQA